MADNSVGTNELVNDSVIDDKVANDAIGTAMIKDNAVTIAKMADNSISTAEVVNSSVTLAKLATAVANSLNPAGTVIWYAGSTAPAGYLKANGDGIANGSGTTQGITTDFSALYAIVGANLPDLRGEFIRGWDDGKGTDSGRSIKSSQSDQNKQHNHSATSSVTDPGHTHTVDAAYHTGQRSDASPAEHDNASNTTRTTSSSTTGISVGTTIANEGGNEARPRNIALLACIKY